MKKKRIKQGGMVGFFSLLIVLGISYGPISTDILNGKDEKTNAVASYPVDQIPAYEKDPYVIVNGNQPLFEEDDYQMESELYSDFDFLGRCGVAFALVGADTMPTEKRGSIGMIKPTGWHTVKYDHISGKYLYNRCHLIGYQLTGENANEKNLITCTRAMNTTGMLKWENLVADYVKKTNHHVLYRVTPHFAEDELLARGVFIEAESLEDHGKGIRFHVYVYNVQEGVIIDYKTGDSQLGPNGL